MTFEDAYDHDESLAAEYVLGTLDADERARAQALIETNSAFAAQIQYWERRLGELHAMVEPVEPPAQTWANINARLDGAVQSEQFVLPRVDEPFDAAPLEDNVVYLSRQLRRWREGTLVAGALAAGLAGFIVISSTVPELLPERLRPKPRVVEVVKTEALPKFVAVLQRDAASPAFILTIDIENRNLTVRRVSADAQAGKSYELWLVSDRFPAPRSLGVVGDSEFTIDNRLTAYDPGTIATATYAVTLEPEGGSPTGAPTGDILWTGKLVQTLPGARAQQPPTRSP
jgi:anti-sigma-K factor RskA